MSSVTMVEKYPQNKRSSIAIRPYFDSSVENMGLQRYGLSLFDGAFHEESIACLEINGIRRYLTGLNEFAPEIKSLPLEDQEAKIKQIRIVVAQLEKELAGVRSKQALAQVGEIAAKAKKIGKLSLVCEKLALLLLVFVINCQEPSLNCIVSPLFKIL